MKHHSHLHPVSVRNITNHSIDLHSHDGDSVTIPVSKNRVTVQAKFLTWVAPHPGQIRVLSELPEGLIEVQ